MLKVNAERAEKLRGLYTTGVAVNDLLDDRAVMIELLVKSIPLVKLLQLDTGDKALAESARAFVEKVREVTG